MDDVSTQDRLGPLQAGGLGQDEWSQAARRLRNAVEPIAANVYFAPEVHRAFEELGFGPGIEEPGSHVLPDLSAYYCSRAGCMGQVPGEVAVAAFGVFNPAVMVPAVNAGWRIAGRDAVLAARERGATASLERMLGDQAGGLARATELLRRAADAASAGGHFLFAGLLSLGFPDNPWGALWRAADLVREHRGDSHIAAWNAAGLDPVEAGLLAEVYYEMPTKRYHYGRGWGTEDLDAGLDRLRRRGIVEADDPVRFTERGRAFREGIEVATDAQERPLLEALGDDFDELVAILEPWALAIVQAGGYPTSVEQIPARWGRLVAP